MLLRFIFEKLKIYAPEGAALAMRKHILWSMAGILTRYELYFIKINIIMGDFL